MNACTTSDRKRERRRAGWEKEEGEKRERQSEHDKTGVRYMDRVGGGGGGVQHPPLEVKPPCRYPRPPTHPVLEVEESARRDEDHHDGVAAHACGHHESGLPTLRKRRGTQGKGHGRARVGYEGRQLASTRGPLLTLHMVPCGKGSQARSRPAAVGDGGVGSTEGRRTRAKGRLG